MGTLPVIVLHKGVRHLAHLRERGGTMPREALLLIGAVVPFDKAILLWMVRIADDYRHTQHVTKADQGDREVAALWSANPARVSIQGNRLGESVGLKGVS